VNFFFFYRLGSGAWAAALADLAEKRRSDLTLATGSSERGVEGLRRSLETYLNALGTRFLDVFFLEYVRPDEDPARIQGPGGALEELQRWKGAGTIRYVGASAHDRAVSRRLAEDPRVDVLMQRYNMAHRAVEAEVFPACRENGVAVVAFTATRWATLLAGHAGWRGAPPRARDCYRFCMAHPDVSVTLAAPATMPELKENLAALGRPAMDPGEVRRWKRYGDLVYGDGTDSFETDWP
jgi:aryl-alcohol dehydrogenase-like predicted oxidoreductase